MANNPYSVWQVLVLNDYPMQIDEFQDAAEHITGRFQSDNRYEISPIFFIDGVSHTRKRDCPGPFMPRPWEQSMCPL